MFVFFSLFEAYTWFGWEVCGVVVGFGVFFGGLYILYKVYFIFRRPWGIWVCGKKVFFGPRETFDGKKMFFRPLGTFGVKKKFFLTSREVLVGKKCFFGSRGTFGVKKKFFSTSAICRARKKVFFC